MANTFQSNGDLEFTDFAHRGYPTHGIYFQSFAALRRHRVYRCSTFQRLSLATSLHGKGGKSSSGAGAFCRIVPSPIIISKTIGFS